MSDLLNKLGIKKIDETYNPYKSIILYGQSGKGKTTTATRDGNALILDINEHGAGVATSGNVVEVKSFEHLKAIIENLEAVKKEIDFDVLVLETVGKLRDIVLAAVMAKNGHLKASQPDYGETATEIKRMLEYLIKQQQKLKFHFVITGHETLNNDKNVDGATINPVVNVDAQQAIQSAITTSVDIVARATIKNVTGDNGDTEQKYIVSVEPSDLFTTKIRMKNNIKLEQYEIENASVSKIVELAETGKIIEGANL